MARYVALLRGINVGGKNLIKMTELRACFEALGLREVSTYIQSGNVIFDAGAGGRAALTRRIEEALVARFAYRARVVVRSRAQLATVVEGAPPGFGAQPARYRYDVLFLEDRLAAAAALRAVPARAGVDEVHPGPGALYYRRLIAKATQSQLARLAALPIYQRLTIRNWNTTTTLRRLLEITA